MLYLLFYHTSMIYLNFKILTAAMSIIFFAKFAKNNLLLYSMGLQFYGLQFYGWWKQKFIIFAGYPFIRAVPLKRAFHIINLLQNAILHKVLKLGFWNFKPIFLRMLFLLAATFLSGCGYLFKLMFVTVSLSFNIYIT